MSSLILALISVAIVIGAVSALAESSVAPQAGISDSFKAMEQRTGDAARTGMTSVSATASLAGTRLDWRVRNSGQTKLRDFSRWDVIVRYHGPGSGDLKVQRLTYTTTDPPLAGQWTVSNIYQGSGAAAEVYEPGIVNPVEEFNIRATLTPAAASPSSNSIAVSAPNGVYLSVAFTN